MKSTNLPISFLSFETKCFGTVSVEVVSGTADRAVASDTQRTQDQIQSRTTSIEHVASLQCIENIKIIK